MINEARRHVCVCVAHVAFFFAQQAFLSTAECLALTGLLMQLMYTSKTFSTCTADTSKTVFEASDRIMIVALVFLDDDVFLQLTCLVLCEDPAARSHSVKQFCTLRPVTL